MKKTDMSKELFHPLYLLYTGIYLGRIKYIKGLFKIAGIGVINSVGYHINGVILSICSAAAMLSITFFILDVIGLPWGTVHKIIIVVVNISIFYLLLSLIKYKNLYYYFNRSKSWLRCN